MLTDPYLPVVSHPDRRPRQQQPCQAVTGVPELASRLLTFHSLWYRPHVVH
jgi:hypothetical protein